METKPITLAVNSLKSDPDFRKNSIWKEEPARPGSTVDFPSELSLQIQNALHSLGINSLYTHQAKCWEEIHKGHNIAVVTSTASGKSLCYNLPILDAYLQNNDLRALYIFPTKALAQDQRKNLGVLISNLENDSITDPLFIATYDGDTSTDQRATIRQKSRFIFSNPDMLHTAILPHHSLWSDFFRNLTFIVIDEIHTYRGVFGSHVANVIRRLKRIANFYGSAPLFILTSATIANPQEHSELLIDEPVTIIDNDGSPHGKKNFILYNPPFVNKDLGIRSSPMIESVRIANKFLNYKVQFLLFTRSRKSVEQTLTVMNEKIKVDSNQVRGYRSGYLPKDRRKIEGQIKNGEIHGVVSTNALELGIDIGGIDAVLMAGYPGSIASVRQQAGRTSRNTRESLAILVASNSPLDQYLFQNPDFFYSSSPEKALINPNNLLILLHHMRCAAFELPFNQSDHFGSVDPTLLNSLLQFLVEEGVIYSESNRFYWMDEKYPARDVSLRTSSTDTVLLVSEHEGAPKKTIGQTDKSSSYWMVHPGAIYLHEWDSYIVKQLDLENNIATLEQADLDYYTEPKKQTTIECLNIQQKIPIFGGEKSFGEIIVTTQVTGYKMVQWGTNIVLGSRDLELPPTTLRTSAFWLSLGKPSIDSLLKQGVWRSSSNDYGKNWVKIRDQIRKRDFYRCKMCGAIEKSQPFHVHHKIPFKLFSSISEANRPDNLITLCPRCHRMAELAVMVRSGLAGLSYLFNHLAPLFLMCDIQDLGSHIEYECAFADRQPTILLYEQVPAGIGLSEEIFRNFPSILSSALSRIQECSCSDGCPACVGPSGLEGAGARAETLAILSILSGGT